MPETIVDALEAALPYLLILASAGIAFALAAFVLIPVVLAS